MKTVLPNPWVATPTRPPFVLKEDRPYVDAWNQAYGRKDDLRLRTDVLPEPFVGPRDAPVVVLGLNPGFGGTEPKEHRVRRFRDALRANLGDDPAAYVNPYLLDEFADTGGGMWAHRCWAAVERAGIPYEQIARRMLAVEFHGYHSRNWALLPITLPSQRYGFELVAAAVDRGAIILLTRGVSAWQVAVPELRRYRRAFPPNTVRRTSISPGNLPPGAFEDVVAALGAPRL